MLVNEPGCFKYRDENWRIGFGLCGSTTAHSLAQHFPTVGYDINAQRVEEILQGIDHNLALSADDLKLHSKITYTAEADALSDREIYIITAPTPIDAQNQPDLGPVRKACRLVAASLQKDNIIIFESTVYPGATEEECVPILSEVSGLKFNVDYFVGYSPANSAKSRRSKNLLCR